MKRWDSSSEGMEKQCINQTRMKRRQKTEENDSSIVLLFWTTEERYERSSDGARLPTKAVEKKVI
jgi:hypothetical protein